MNRHVLSPIVRATAGAVGLVASLAILPVTPASAQERVALAGSAPPFEAPPPELLMLRRAELLDSIGTGAVLVKSSRIRDLETEYLQDADFRQTNDFLFLTGIEVADSWLLLEAGPGGRVETLFIPERDPSQERWTGPRPSIEEAAAITGITDVRVLDEFEEVALSAAGRARSLGAPLYAPLGESTAQDPLVRRLVFEHPVDVRAVAPRVAQLRLTKDEFELRMLRRAIDVTAAAQMAAMRTMRPGMYEYETEAVIEYNFRAGGAERVGFPSIIGSGPNSVVLHYDRNRRPMEDGDMVVMDIGAEYSYYTADVTRTVPVSGRFTARQRAVYKLVLASQLAGIAAARPGATMGDVDRASRSYMREHSGDICGDRTCDAFFIHGIGHWLGMDVHDVGSYSTPFEPGMVLTVEPGIYLPEENLGIRIEDDVLVTDGDAEVLSAEAPRTVDEIERLMRRRIRMR